MDINRSALVERFLKYVVINTASDPRSTSFPSTSVQMDFAEFMIKECVEVGLSDIKKDSYGYVTATLPSNIEDSADIPVIGFLAHMDTSSSASGENVKPNIVESYDGNDIKLNGNITLSPNEFPHMKQYIGQDLITTDGTTLLGADNKAGIAEILTAMEYLINNPQIKHGTIRVAFTPDEEIGRGVDHFNVEDFNAKFAYTIDGGEIGELENESFNASSITIEVIGKSVHPGTAKDVLVNAGLIASEIVAMFPKSETPEATEGYEGFYFLTDMVAAIEHAKLNYIIRDHDKDKLEERKQFAKNVVEKINAIYDNRVTLNISDQYQNMREVIDKHPNIMELAKEAMLKANVEPNIKPIRGGTDGSRLSFMGLPCPNIFTGGHNFHGPFEYIPIDSMVKACEVIVNICELNAKK